MKEYKEVPNILTGKDLDYLTDLFNWNFTAYKVTVNSYEHTKDNELRKIMEKASKIFCESMNDVISILEGGMNE
jgi:hypothetical protein